MDFMVDFRRCRAVSVVRVWCDVSGLCAVECRGASVGSVAEHCWTGRAPARKVHMRIGGRGSVTLDPTQLWSQL